MEIAKKLLNEFQNRLIIGCRRGVLLNAITGSSGYIPDISRLSFIDKKLHHSFINSMLSERHFRFKICWNDNDPDLCSLFKKSKLKNCI